MSLLTRVRDVLDRLATAEPLDAYEAGDRDFVSRDDVASPGDLAILLLDLDEAIRAEEYVDALTRDGQAMGDYEGRADVPDALWARALPTTPPPDAP